MAEITGEMLIAFGEANNMRIMSHRDPNKWAEKINKNNGKCPCGKECPCDDCTCMFYEKSVPGKETIMVNNTEIASAIETLEKAKDALMNIQLDEPEKTARAMEEAANMVEKDAIEHKCGQCEDYMMGLARKLNFMRDECGKDTNSCMTERDLTIERIEGMQETFIAADELITKAEQETARDNGSHGENHTDEDIPEAFHDCITRTTKTQLQDLKHGDRICTASKMCGTKKLTKEDAVASCVKGA